MSDSVLLIDDDSASVAALRAPLEAAGLRVEVTSDNLVAIEELKGGQHCAVVLDPMIRHRLNGFAVLSYIELEQPDLMSRVFLSTAMPRQTIARTAPALVSRLFRKPAETAELVAALLEATGRRPPEETPKKSVLIVEDDAVIARFTSRALTRLGYSCEWAPTGAAAMENVATSSHDAILLDLVLPDVDGRNLLRHLRAVRPELLDRVVVITGMPPWYLEEPERECIRGVLRKPFDVRAFERLLSRREDPVIPEGGGEVPMMDGC